MHVTKCDICKKDKNDKFVSVGKGFLHRIELCYTCGSPIMELLKKHGKIKEETYEKRKI